MSTKKVAPCNSRFKINKTKPPRGAPRGTYFSQALADHAVRFIQALRHTKGKWAGEPFILLPWQRKIIEEVFGWRKPNGCRLYKYVYIEIPKKNGKALEVDTPVPTPDGWKRHGELRPGDYVFSPSGTPVKVLGVTPAYRGPCYQLSFSDGTSIVAHAQHEWITERAYYTKRHSGSRAPLPCVTTEEIAQTLSYSQGHVHSIRLSKPLELPTQDLLIDPYVLGAWLGDGHSAGARITSADAEILQEMGRRGYPAELYSRYEYLVGRGKLQVQLRQLGLLKNKHIPTNYLRASLPQRLDLLRGLMDTDGYVSKAGQCELTLCRRALFFQAVELIRSLGYKVSVREDRAKIYGKDCGPRYRAQFWGYTDSPVFLLPRKAARLKHCPPRPTRSAKVKVTAAEPAGEREVNCIQVEGGVYLAGEGFTPTHNSELAAAVALYLLFADGEAGAEVYGAATDRDQARIVFDVAADMVRMSPALLKRCKIIDSIKRIVYPETSSFYRVLSKEVKAKHGFNTSGLVLDELHAQPDRELVDVLTKGAGAARQQPLFFIITTAGLDRKSICREYHDKARAILDGTREDPTFYPVIYGPPEDAQGWDWEDEANWYEVNPSLGSVLSIEEMRDEYRTAKGNLAEEQAFQQLRLNMWVSNFVKGMPMAAWDACGPKRFDLDEYLAWCEELKGRECYAGMDLSSTTDLTSLVLVFPFEGGSYRVLPFFWLPLDNLDAAARRDHVAYPIWALQKLVRPTPGNVVDYDAVIATLEELRSLYKIREIAADPYNVMQLIKQLTDLGYPVLSFSQSVLSISPPTKELLRLTLEGKLQHGGNPVLRWNADNLQLCRDANDNVKPNKAKATGRIDGVVALVMALDRAIRHEAEGPSVYESRGIIRLSDLSE